MTCILDTTQKLQVTPQWPHMEIIRLCPLLILLLLPDRRGHLGWHCEADAKSPLRLSPQLCSHISSVSVTTAMRFKGRWPRAWPRLQRNLLSGRQSRRDGAGNTFSHTHTHTGHRAIWPRHIMRVINVSVECVIDRWRACWVAGPFTIEKIEMTVSGPHRQKHTNAVYSTICQRQCQSFHLAWPSHPSVAPDEIVWIFM